MSEIVGFGPTLGYYRRRAIPAFILHADGRKSEFVRIAILTSGGVELSQLAGNECVITPGLIYRETKGVEERPSDRPPQQEQRGSQS